MRIIKMSDLVVGFESLGSCKEFFKSVLPWQKYCFYFAGEGKKVAKDKLNEGEVVLFCYNGSVVAIAKVKDLIPDENRIRGIEIDKDTLKILNEDISLKGLEVYLKKFGYVDRLYGGQGWNIISGEHEKKAISYVRNKEWAIYRK